MGNPRPLIAQWEECCARLRPVAPVRHTPDQTGTAESNFGRRRACDHAELTKLHAVLASGASCQKAVRERGACKLSRGTGG